MKESPQHEAATTLAAAGQRLEREVFARIPLAAAMQIRVAEYEASRLVLAAPFAPNRNHVGIAFGGAIECLGLLACWGLLWLRLDDTAVRIVVARSNTEFRAPLTGDTLHAEAVLPDEDTWRSFGQALERGGRARIELSATIGDSTQADAARFRGCFAVKRQA